MESYAIYQHPDDAPESFVVRRWVIEGGNLTPGLAAEVDSLEEARQLVPAGLHRIPRDEHDVPSLVETWA